MAKPKKRLSILAPQISDPPVGHIAVKRKWVKPKRLSILDAQISDPPAVKRQLKNQAQIDARDNAKVYVPPESVPPPERSLLEIQQETEYTPPPERSLLEIQQETEFFDDYLAAGGFQRDQAKPHKPRKSSLYR